MSDYFDVSLECEILSYYALDLQFRISNSDRALVILLLLPVFPASVRESTSDYCKDCYICQQTRWAVRNCFEGETRRQSNIWVLDA